MSLQMKKSYDSILLFLVASFIFFGYAYKKPMGYVTLLVVLLLLLPKLRHVPGGTPFRQHRTYFCLAAGFAAFMVLQIPFSIFQSNSFKVILVRLTLIAIGFLFMFYSGWYELGFTMILAFSVLHMGFTLFQYLMPDAFHGFINPLLSEETRYWISYYLERGFYSGITDQVLKNGFFVTIGIGAVFCSAITAAKKRTAIFFFAMFILFIAALFLTGKRGLLLASAAGLTAVGLFSPTIRLKPGMIVRRILPALLILALVVFLFFPEASIIFEKFTINDISSGRFIIYGRAYDMFLEKPFFGWGAGVYYNIYGRGIHNLYLQLLTENGLIGFFIAGSAIVFNLKQVIRNIRDERAFPASGSGKVLLFSLYLQIIFIVHGLTENAMNDSFVFLSYLIAASVPYSLRVSGCLAGNVPVPAKWAADDLSHRKSA